MDVLEVLRGRLRDRDAGLARAREGDDRDVRMLDEPLPNVTAAAVDDVEHALRQPGLGEELNVALTQRGRVGRRLEDDRVAADDRRQRLPGRDRDRKVPG